MMLPGEAVLVDFNSKKYQFPGDNDPPSVHMSVIAPAFNEEERLPRMLEEVLVYFGKRKEKDPNYSYEIIVVDDGSADGTSKAAWKVAKAFNSSEVKVLTLKANRGKGGAVRRGVLAARGQYVLMADADGATQFSDVEKLEVKMKEIERNTHGISVGSRAHLEKESVAKRTIFRTILMYGFHMLVKVLCVKGIKDTQCGFKLFTRNTARLLFHNLHIEKWAFDVELLFLGESLNIPMTEVVVNWKEIPGSKLSPLAASVQMARDLIRIRAFYMLGIWSISKKSL